MTTTTDLTLLDNLCRVARLYGQGHHLTVNEVSKALFSDTRRLGRLNRTQNAHDLKANDYGVALRKMADNWPTTVEWPAEVNRPGA